MGTARHVRLYLVTLMLALAFVFPTMAHARSYEVISVNIDATVAQDGSLSVVESRTYQFDGEFNGIYWDVPCGTYEGHSVTASVLSVDATLKAGNTTLQEASDGADGTYEVTEESTCLRLTLHQPAHDEKVTFRVSYKLSDLVTRWADVGELYWQYVPADESSGVEWEDVAATIHLPVPDGEVVVPGENVRAWGHGPLDGEIDFRGDEVTLFSPGVGSAEYLEARVVFPASWLPGVSAESKPHLQTVLFEEDAWAKNANAKRWKARLIVYGLPGLMVLIGLGSVIATWWILARGKKQLPKAQFKDPYFRDVPTDDHPAVLGMLYREGLPSAKDFSATLMRLTDQGRVTIHDTVVEKSAALGRKKLEHEWRLLLHRGAVAKKRDDNVSAACKKIDDAAFDFLYDVVADKHKHVIDESLLGPSGEPYILMSFFDEVADGWPGAYRKGYMAWSDAVRAAYDKRKFEKKGEDTLLPGVLGLADFALATILGIACMLLGVPDIAATIAFIVCFGAGIYVVLVDDDEPKVIFSQESAEIKARLKALKSWLTDFTRLEEAIPTDVVLWNRLLVMATELDVAEKVIEQLRVYAPEVMEDPGFVMREWYARGVGSTMDTPVNVLGNSIGAVKGLSPKNTHHYVSTYGTATSHNSSSRGSGGGFSSGGGGGFSGGGRGGAF